MYYYYYYYYYSFNNNNNTKMMMMMMRLYCFWHFSHAVGAGAADAKDALRMTSLVSYRVKRANESKNFSLVLRSAKRSSKTSPCATADSVFTLTNALT